MTSPEEIPGIEDDFPHHPPLPGYYAASEEEYMSSTAAEAARGGGIPYWSLFNLVAHLGFYIMCVFVILGLTAALFYLAEVAEEHTMLAKRLLRCHVVALSSILVLMLALDPVLPAYCALSSLVAQLVYFSGHLGRNFPWVRVASPQAVASYVVFAADNVCWMIFLQGSVRIMPFWAAVSTLLLVVWVTPIGLFVSLAVTDECLPSARTSSSSVGGFDNGDHNAKRRTFATFFASLLPARLLGKRN